MSLKIGDVIELLVCNQNKAYKSTDVKIIKESDDPLIEIIKRKDITIFSDKGSLSVKTESFEDDNLIDSKTESGLTDLAGYCGMIFIEVSEPMNFDEILKDILISETAKQVKVIYRPLLVCIGYNTLDLILLSLSKTYDSKSLAKIIQDGEWYSEVKH